MFDVNDDAKAGLRRVEMLTGPGRRRRWSAEEKARIVAETLAAGARVSEVARRWQICPQQVFAWRHQARLDVAVQPAAEGETDRTEVCAHCHRLGACEPLRVCRRLHSLRRWSYDEANFQSIFT